ncbi:signal peptidase I [Spirulina subsalsa FACHB-351]|uniref:Signal peptidase I n=1 Tax=Spirulina subsalsa FACHB-351 TaxID=234711 RepID=A0ABT3LAF9_9CYAN|nr:signal peptidase I [Spirulina subsalsa]MCW6038498.1 signal peptidase I [Spirulina subsalsa FACHB-351]
MSEKQDKPTNVWVEIGSIVGTSIVLALIIRTFLGDVRYIPSESMLPTLQVNDRLIIDKVTLRFRTPYRGEIIVFYPPDTALKCDPTKTLPIRDAYIKRVIGLPGDKIEVTGGQIFVNGQLLTENYINEPPNYEGTFPTVPADSYLVLGDNRNKSCDSFVWGVVPAENIIGRAMVRIWPLNRLGSRFD